MSVAVTISPAAQEQFEDLPVTIRVRVGKVLDRLEFWPEVSGARPLSGDLAGSFRIRTGDYRVQFRVITADPEASPPVAAQVYIEKVGHRDGFYED